MPPMQVNDQNAALARRQVDPRDRTTAEHRADAPEAPDARSVELGAAASHADRAKRDEHIDPRAVADRARSREKGRLVDIRV
ncbi:MAG TPA: hypothetical protein VG943_07175 [Caulobacterales bacterium]|nr:hypothetical protein [Caulobacterales bacterium]